MKKIAIKNKKKFAALLTGGTICLTVPAVFSVIHKNNKMENGQIGVSNFEMTLCIQDPLQEKDYNQINETLKEEEIYGLYVSNCDIQNIDFSKIDSKEIEQVMILDCDGIVDFSNFSEYHDLHNLSIHRTSFVNLSSIPRLENIYICSDENKNIDGNALINDLHKICVNQNIFGENGISYQLRILSLDGIEVSNIPIHTEFLELNYSDKTEVEELYCNTADLSMGGHGSKLPMIYNQNEIGTYYLRGFDVDLYSLDNTHEIHIDHGNINGNETDIVKENLHFYETTLNYDTEFLYGTEVHPLDHTKVYWKNNPNSDTKIILAETPLQEESNFTK